MKLSDTDIGSAWLSNFSTYEIETATLLLDTLRIDRWSDIRAGLKLRLEQLAGNSELVLPVLVVPALSLEDISSNAPTHVAFDTYEFGAPISATPGSEGVVGNLVRDLRANREDQDGRPAWLGLESTLDDLRDKQCRSIVLLTDYAGSGTQLYRMAETIARHPTIRSWRSYGLLKVHALSHAMSTAAQELLTQKQSPLDGVWAMTGAPSFDDAPWSKQSRVAIEELCHTHVLRKWRRWPLGFRGSAGLFATDTSVPNNLPALFLQESSSWKPLLPSRTMPAELSEQGLEAPREELRALAQRIGQRRMARNGRLEHLRPQSSDLLAMLARLNQGHRTALSLAAETRRDEGDISALLGALNRLGMIDDEQRVTELGRDELRAAKRLVRHSDAGLEGSSEMYYPQSLR